MLQKDNWQLHNVWVLILCVVISFLCSSFYYKESERDAEENIKHISNYYADRTENFVNSVFHKTDVLAAVVRLQRGNITEATFNEIAPLVYAKDSGIRGIQYMPKGIVTYSYPVEGNEAVIGKDFFKIPERRKDVLLAVDTKSIALSGPYNLLQGGLGVVARNPVFLTDAAGKEYFWGFSTIILDLPKAIETVGLSHLTESGYDYQLFCINENNERLVIEGNADLNVKHAIQCKIKVPHHEWLLVLAEKNPWVNEGKAGALFAFGCVLGIAFWQLYCALKQKEAAVLAKGKFFSNISHDMRTPLNAIIGFAEMAQWQGMTAANKDEYLGKIVDSGHLLQDFINDTLLISKLSSGKLTMHPVPVLSKNIIAPVLETISMLAQQKGVIFEYNNAGCKTRTVMASAMEVDKILLNLLNNAIKFTPAGKHVWLTVLDEQVDNQLARVKFIIKDEGIGMEQQFLPHVFEPFAQEQRSGYEGIGTGLGLSIVKQLVDTMQGTITMDSEVGKGTTFTVCLPFEEVATPVEEKGPIIAKDFALLANKKVLLCEDNALNIQIAVGLLKHKGMLIDIAKNGKEGVSKFANSTSGEYAAILMDLRMPVMDGFEATREIRSMAKADAGTIPIIAMTADAFAEDVQKCLHSGMNDHIAKPINPTILYETIAKFIS